MNEKERQEEENLAALLKAGYPGEGALDARLRGGFYGRLAKNLIVRPAFPGSVLGLLCGLLLLLEALAAGAVCGLLSLPLNDFFALLIVGIVALNLLCLPIAFILVVSRSKYA